MRSKYHCRVVLHSGVPPDPPLPAAVAGPRREQAPRRGPPRPRHAGPRPAATRQHAHRKHIGVFRGLYTRSGSASPSPSLLFVVWRSCRRSCGAGRPSRRPARRCGPSCSPGTRRRGPTRPRRSSTSPGANWGCCWAKWTRTSALFISVWWGYNHEPVFVTSDSDTEIIISDFLWTPYIFYYEVYAGILKLN